MALMINYMTEDLVPPGTQTCAILKKFLEVNGKNISPLKAGQLQAVDNYLSGTVKPVPFARYEATGGDAAAIAVIRNEMIAAAAAAAEVAANAEAVNGDGEDEEGDHLQGPPVVQERELRDNAGAGEPPPKRLKAVSANIFLSWPRVLGDSHVLCPLYSRPLSGMFPIHI